jgi:hypothetical protein
VTHVARYPGTVADIPRERHTTGADFESHLGREGRSVNLSAEGAVTGGPALRQPGANAPGGERWYGATSVAPELGRLSLSYQYQVFGYDFDGTFMSYGSDWAGHTVNGGLDLDGAPGFRWLADLPLYNKTLAKNLRLSWNYWNWATRSRYENPLTGRLEPRSTEWTAELALGNDAEARPNFWLGVDPHDNADQWWRTSGVDESFVLRLPLWWELILPLKLGAGQGRETDRTTLERGTGWSRKVEAGLERYFRGDLHVHAEVKWRVARKSWEGAWSDPEAHTRVTGGVRQSLGPNSFLQVDFGLPALNGEDFGAQDTLNVVTVLLKTYI